MNVLDKVALVLGLPNIKKGYMPDKPDAVIALFEYDATPPNQYFDVTEFVYNVQVRVRDLDQTAAYGVAKNISSALNRYTDSEATILQSGPVLDIGRDDANPQRQEYTINFEIRRN